VDSGLHAINQRPVLGADLGSRQVLDVILDVISKAATKRRKIHKKEKLKTDNYNLSY
jgi:hypothetical protein